MERVVEDFGKIDVFVANAGELHDTYEHGVTPHKLTFTKGMAISKPILEQTLDEYQKQMSVNGTKSPSRTIVIIHSLTSTQLTGSFTAPNTPATSSNARASVT
jgi:NAD(P)-dependent dehydrogenase (short-subunit alcohol dehydrogenase family)